MHFTIPHAPEAQPSSESALALQISASIQSHHHGNCQSKPKFTQRKKHPITGCFFRLIIFPLAARLERCNFNVSGEEFFPVGCCFAVRSVHHVPPAVSVAGKIVSQQTHKNVLQ